MSTLLEKALAAVSRLPESEQEALAAWILDELDHDRRWQKAFAGSHDAQLLASYLVPDVQSVTGTIGADTTPTGDPGCSGQQRTNRDQRRCTDRRR